MSSGLRSLLQKAGHYFIGNGLGMLSGIISYPILTRVLGAADYGTMSLISPLLLGSVAVAKLGVTSSGVRFFHDLRKEDRLQELVSTCMSFTLGMAVVTTLVQVVTSWGLGQAGVVEAELAALLVLTAPLVILRTWTSMGMSFVRAAEWTRAYNVLDVLGRYLSLGMALLFVVVLQGGVRGFFKGLLVAEAVTTAVILWQVRRLVPWRLTAPQRALLRQLLLFGLPLVGFELTNILLAFGDRAVVRALVGEEALGHYSAAYNLGDTLQKFLMFPIALSVQPMYMRLWAEEGPEATADFLSKAASFFFLLSIPAVVGVTAVRRPLLLLLAGPEYLDGADVLPLSFGGYMLYGGYAVLAAGLFLHKKTARTSVAALVAAGVNLVLNLVLVPRLGILGAAVATAISYLGLLVALCVMSFRLLPFALPWAATLRFVGISAVMYAAIAWIELGEPLWTLVARVLVGAAVFLGLALGADRRTRALVRQMLRR
jgi:O-antigen/teichoic acid export membrane protein